MHYTIELLINGDRRVSDYYCAAVEHWREIWSKPESRDIVSLATILSSEQLWFERNCGSRWVGQEIMVASGIAMLYTTKAGFEKNAERARFLFDAFQRSFCSIEVKSIAQKVAASYNLFEQQVA